MMVRALMFSFVGLASAAARQGTMSMWSETHDTLVAYKSEGSACKYADRLMGGLSSATAQTPYITSKNYCAVNRGLFGNGEVCGRCYRLTYRGGHEQGLGRPGSDVVQIVDSGSWATFDCHMTAFSKITHYDTGFFPITYEEVACDTFATGPVAGVLQYDYYFTKIVFSNLRYPVQSAELTIGGKKHEMKLIGGWWSAWTGPIQGKTSFKITEENGFVVNFPNCFNGEWTNRKTGDACYANRGHRSAKLLANDTLSEGVEKTLELAKVESNVSHQPQLQANNTVLFP
ncbi:EXPA13 [Symbiodinium microadriaticum]|nr:EXPA13 [Symbiodinium microadriaticum]CAE7946110.1 EXPA13 [Symbiodinium sp. KB8]